MGGNNYRGLVLFVRRDRRLDNKKAEFLSFVVDISCPAQVEDIYGRWAILSDISTPVWILLLLS